MSQHFRLHKLLQATMQRHFIRITVMLRRVGRVRLATHHLFLDNAAVLRRILIVAPIQRQTIDIVQIQQLIACKMKPSYSLVSFGPNCSHRCKNETLATKKEREIKNEQKNKKESGRTCGENQQENNRR